MLVDWCAFGSNLEECLDIAKLNSIHLIFVKDYQSFEYFLLKSDFICDSDLQEFRDKNLLKFISDERLYTYRLEQLTDGERYEYSKKMSEDALDCYLNPCCFDRDKLTTCEQRDIVGRPKEPLFFTEDFRWLLDHCKCTRKNTGKQKHVAKSSKESKESKEDDDTDNVVSAKPMDAFNEK